MDVKYNETKSLNSSIVEVVCSLLIFNPWNQAKMCSNHLCTIWELSSFTSKSPNNTYLVRMYVGDREERKWSIPFFTKTMFQMLNHLDLVKKVLIVFENVFCKKWGDTSTLQKNGSHQEASNCFEIHKEAWLQSMKFYSLTCIFKICRNLHCTRFQLFNNDQTSFQEHSKFLMVMSTKNFLKQKHWCRTILTL